MKGTVVLLWLLPCVIYGARQPEPRSKNRLSLFSATNAEIQSVSQELYLADVNRAASGDITLNLQYKVSSSQTGTGSDYASQKLFSYVNEAKLFARPTFSRLKSLLDNYVKTTGTVESVTSAEVQEQNAFIDEIFKTSVITKLSNFFLSKGFYNSVESFKADLTEMWFGLYTRTKGPLDSSGFEHVFHGEIHNGKISGFHNWVQLYLQEKAGQVNYLSYSYDGPWTNYPDVLAFQYKWSSYVKSLGSFFIGSSPEFDIAMYTLCFVTRPDSLCTVSVDGKSLQIQTYTWANASYGNGKKYVGSTYPNAQ